MTETIYRIKDLSLRLDCSTLTVKRWEKRKYIPQARRDAKGWRVYTSEEIEKIVKNAQKTNNFFTRKNYSSKSQGR